MYCELIVNRNSWMLQDMDVDGFISEILKCVGSGDVYLGSNIIKRGISLYYKGVKEITDERITPEYFMEKSKEKRETGYWVCLMMLLDNGESVSISLRVHNKTFNFTSTYFTIDSSGVGIHSINDDVDDDSVTLLKLRALGL
jgi:hypothetical protein